MLPQHSVRKFPVLWSEFEWRENVLFFQFFQLAAHCYKQAEFDRRASLDVSGSAFDPNHDPLSSWVWHSGVATVYVL